MYSFLERLESHAVESSWGSGGKAISKGKSKRTDLLDIGLVLMRRCLMPCALGQGMIEVIK